jgi:hypothetical protein
MRLAGSRAADEDDIALLGDKGPRKPRPNWGSFLDEKLRSLFNAL